MSGFYIMRYVGRTGQGQGAIYIGHGHIAGVDVFNGRYVGQYTQQPNGKLFASAVFSFPEGGTLVTGQSLPAGAQLQVLGELTPDYDSGAPQTLVVQGNPVDVVLEKIASLP